ncbi:MAG: CvpA family protein [Pseudodesulfovibrio sp.]|jgi:membrane protein required for colicin V production|uniref:Membrane protein required for colicin V production n=1 Tax=Pseudodesulfovibrio indicus TaxID=1716143 RepID=A0AA94PLH2_9BACT|nr:CvpA family protein [Pseudodesulfovibrio indicus]TDT88718.1 membrane protein required for colicin V production [Pseudodesulfovibrio indicus]
MNFLDIILICIILLFLIRGFFRGLVQEVLSLIAILLAFFLASRFDDVLAPYLKAYIESDVTVGALSYTLIFVATLIVVWLLTKLLKSVLELSLLGWIDRTAGGVFGLLEGVLICMVGLLFLQTFAPKSDILNESFIAPRTRHMVEALHDYVDLPQALSSAKGVLGIGGGDKAE